MDHVCFIVCWKGFLEQLRLLMEQALITLISFLTRAPLQEEGLCVLTGLQLLAVGQKLRQVCRVIKPCAPESNA